MRGYYARSGSTRLRLFGLCGIACIALLDTSCGRRKDGIIVEVTDELAQAGGEVRDWRRSGMGALDVQIYTATAVPSGNWTLAAYNKDGKLLTSGRIKGPQAREDDLVWIHLATPDRMLFDKADRVVLGADLSSPKPTRPDPNDPDRERPKR